MAGDELNQQSEALLGYIEGRRRRKEAIRPQQFTQGKIVMW
jgi:hypothetical protein